MSAPGLLASVATLAEMDLAIAGGADIVDLKDPAHGALGAWADDALATAVARWRALGPAAPLLSATIGDHPLEAATLVAGAARVAALGVPLVKIGFALPPEGAAAVLTSCLAALAPLAKRTRLIAVLFADLKPDLSVIPAFAEAGFHGVMLDTARKGAGSLRTHLAEPVLAAFVASARAARLLTGLAGSLTLDDVAPLAKLRPDYLGFRGALCATGRTGALDPARLAAVRTALRPAEAA